MSERSLVIVSAAIGAVCGAAAGFLLFTDRGREWWNRLEPAVDDLRREVMRFQRTAEKVGDMAVDGLRAVNEFNAARATASRATSPQ